MNIKLCLALTWSMVLIIDIIVACLGYESEWMLVFYPLITLVFNCWTDYFTTH